MKKEEGDPNSSTQLFNKGNDLLASQDYKNAIECYNQILRIDPSNKNAFCNKGKALKAIGDNKNAIECYNQALKIDPNEKYTLFHKGIALQAIGENKNAIQCYDQVLKIDPSYLLAKKNKEEVTQAIINNKDQKEFQECANQELTDKLKYYFGEYAAPIASHLENLIDCINYFEESYKLMPQLEDLVGETRKDIDKLSPNDQFTQKVKANFLEIEKKKNDELKKMNEIKNSGIKVKEEVAKQTSETLQKLQQEILELRQQILKNEKRIDEHQIVLEKGGVIDEAKIKQEFENLHEENSNLSLYFKVFYWTMSNYLQSYRIMSTGIVPTNSNLNVSNTEKSIDIFAKVGKALPVVGSVIGAIDSAIHAVFEIIREHKFQNNKSAINKIIMAKLISEKEISIQISLAAIEIINFKKKEIIFPQTKEVSKIHKICNLITEKVTLIKSKLIEESVIPFEQNNQICEIAVQDVTFLLTYMYKHSDEIVNRKESLSKQLIEIIKYDQISTLFIDQDKTAETQPARSNDSSCCTVFIVNRTLYDNRLLNYPTTFWSLANSLGISEAITLGQSMIKKEILDGQHK